MLMWVYNTKITEDCKKDAASTVANLMKVNTKMLLLDDYRGKLEPTNCPYPSNWSFCLGCRIWELSTKSIFLEWRSN